MPVLFYDQCNGTPLVLYPISKRWVTFPISMVDQVKGSRTEGCDAKHMFSVLVTSNLGPDKSPDFLVF